MKNETERKVFCSDGSVYSAKPSVCIEQTWTSLKLAALPCWARAATSFVGVAAAPWTNTVSPTANKSNAVELSDQLLESGDYIIKWWIYD